MDVGLSLTVGHRRIAYDDPVGAAAGRLPVILVHGSSVHRGIWRDVVAGLSADFRPISFDHPGHGGSSLPTAASVADLVEVLAGVYAALEIERAALIGFSLGGAVAQLFHARHRGTIAALGLISTAPCFGLPPEVIARWRADPAAYAADELALSLAPGAPEAVRERMVALRAGVSEEGQAADLTACADWTMPVPLPRIDCPLLAMTASDDIPLLQEQARRWANEVPGARLAEIAGAGHFMLVEQPERCLRAIHGWLSALA
jgi:3-oxoadipate enol-lactonase